MISGDDFNYEFGEAPAEFTSNSQKARKWTEDWVLREMYCPACGAQKLVDFANNTPVADFFCGTCNEEFELKSKGGRIGRTVPDGAYATMMERLNSPSKPNLMMLSYDTKVKSVRDFAVVPKQFFIPELIHKRNPLSQNAKRAGWIGCDIKVDRVPDIAKIPLIVDSIARPKEEVLSRWGRTVGFQKKSIKDMGWLADVLRSVEKIGQKEFSLADIYKFENYLSELHPDNNNVKPKIRQQLQLLRDAGYLEFLGRGHYRLTE